MHHNLIIKNGDATQVEKEILVDGVQFIDKEPVEGSFNPVTSDGVANAIGEANEAIGEANKAIGEANKELSYIKQLLTNPLSLPANTIRCKFTSDYTPTMGTSQTLVDSNDNVWDIMFETAASLFANNANLLQVIGANTAGVTSMADMFVGCSNLTSVPLFDTSSVTNMADMFYNCIRLPNVPLFDTSSATIFTYMFYSCTKLTSVPLFDTSSVTNMSYMLYGCRSVSGGALALYQQASAMSPQPTHDGAFTSCGSSTVTGSAELAQIPASWGGTAT